MNIDSFTACYAIIIGINSILINGCLLTIILKNAELRNKDYIRLIFNRTFIDFLYGFILSIWQPLGIFLSATNPTFCTTAAYATLWACTAITLGEPLLAFNRFLAMLYPDVHTKFAQTTKSILIMCAGIWLVAAAAPAPHIYFGTLGREPGLVCTIIFKRPETTLATSIFEFPLLGIGLSLLAYFNLRIFRYVRYHQKLANHANRDQLKHDRSILKYITVAGIAPLIFQSPIAVISIVKMYELMDLSPWVLLASCVVFSATPILNALLTLLMVSALKKEFLLILKKVSITLSKKKNSVAAA